MIRLNSWTFTILDDLTGQTTTFRSGGELYKPFPPTHLCPSPPLARLNRDMIAHHAKIIGYLMEEASQARLHLARLQEASELRKIQRSLAKILALLEPKGETQ